MVQYSRQASRTGYLVGALLVIAGLGTLAIRVQLPELRAVELRNAVHTWWPLLLIAAGIIWWMAPAQEPGECSRHRSEWQWPEARNGN